MNNRICICCGERLTGNNMPPADNPNVCWSCSTAFDDLIPAQPLGTTEPFFSKRIPILEGSTN
jgi:hypothetical protein